MKNYEPLEKMPQLCFGTAQGNLEVTLPKALEVGYRHIDCANTYGKTSYRNIIKNAIKSIPRNELWITWKSNEITFSDIQKLIFDIDCQYIDLYLIHHSCGTSKDFIELKKAYEANLIRFYGVSNCENIEIMKQLKKEHNIYANQIQARPPGGQVINRKIMDHDFITKCNELGIIIMLFSTVSGIMNALDMDYDYFFGKFSYINKYYIQKFIYQTNNVLIVSSISGSSIGVNLTDFGDVMNKCDMLAETEINEIENKLLETNLNFQSTLLYMDKK
jgi:diketogulonate reductase-like aldo/keto reductase